jgi:Tfp pilus assembly protein PilV
MRCRRGVSLVEVLLAILLIDFGLLALVAGSAVLVRQTTALRLRNAALRAASNRVQQLGGGPCAASSGSVTTPDGMREDWLVAPSANRMLDVRDSVTLPAGIASRSVVLVTRLPC